MNIDLFQVGTIIAILVNVVTLANMSSKAERRLTIMEMDIKYIKRALDLTKRGDDE